MNDSHIVSVEQIKNILNYGQLPVFEAVSKKEAYRWVEGTLIKFGYLMLDKESKGIVRQYLMRMTGYSEPQVTRFISQYRKTGRVRLAKYQRHRFEKKYPDGEIKLLAETDRAHQYLSGPAIKTILKRQFEVFGEEEFENISKISVSHIYNLRQSRYYQRMAGCDIYTPTKPSVTSSIGERRKPEPNGKPGYLRVESVHQGDKIVKDGNGSESQEKGLYHINTIDEVTQFEIIGAAEKISERYLVPVLKLILNAYPFRVIEFHPDNGSEFINHVIADLLNKLLIELTKSRPRHTNDNALVEGKNGSIVRKYIGYTHIEQKHADEVNQFYFNYLNHYLNYHRPCAYPVEIEDQKKKGKIKKIYPQEEYQVPYEKLKSLPNANRFLKEGVTFKELDKIAYVHDDNQYAKLMQEARDKLFDKILIPNQFSAKVTSL
jgi:hypothetical protein